MSSDRRQRDDRHLRALARGAQAGRAGRRIGDDRREFQRLGDLARGERNGVGAGRFRLGALGVDDAGIGWVALDLGRRCGSSSPPPRPDSAPAADSADSMMASAPSNTAVATSDTSARVGTGAVIIDSSICVATTTGLPARRAARVICFWMPGTASSGISTPRSPRATISASESSMISASRATACGFSILDKQQRPAARDLARFGQILRPLDERQRHPVDAGGQHGVEVLAVLLGQRADRQVGVGQADALLVGNLGAGDDGADDRLAVARVPPSAAACRRRSAGGGRPRPNCRISGCGR